MTKGSIVAVKDLVVRVEFAEDMPEIGEVVLVQNEEKSPLLVDSLASDTIAICINLRSNKRIKYSHTF